MMPGPKVSCLQEKDLTIQNWIPLFYRNREPNGIIGVKGLPDTHIIHLNYGFGGTQDFCASADCKRALWHD